MISRRTKCALLMPTAALLAGWALSAAEAQTARETPAADSAGLVRTETVWPTGDRRSSVLAIERKAPAEVRVGQQFQYEIQVINLTQAELRDVVITEQLVAGLEIKTIDPQPDETKAGVATWKISKLAGSAAKVIRISGVAGAVGTISPCNTVTLGTGACQQTAVVQPALKLVKTAPADVIICDPIPVKLVVTNTGTGTATGVTINDTLPEGWTTSDGKGAFIVNVGTLRAGESRDVTVELRATKTGSFTNEAVASEAAGLTAKASAKTVVRQPVLEVTKKGPDMVYANRPVTYEITVSNKGDAPAKDTLLVDTLDPGVKSTQASDGGRVESGRVTWNLGTLAPGASKSVKVTSVAAEIKTIHNTATATAYCAEAKASASTVVKGIPAILLEVEDTDDPVEVGAQTTYVIVVTNQGSANDANIRIRCTLPAEEEFVSADGPTKHEVAGKVVTFAPLPTLAPKAKATYRVVVKGVRAEDVRFAVELNSEMLTKPVNETESTHIYE